MKKVLMTAVLSAGMLAGGLAYAQEAAAEAAPAAGLVENAQGGGATQAPKQDGFFAIIFGSGVVASLIWLALFGVGGVVIYLVVDNSIMVRPQKIMPQSLITNVKAAMAEGDVVKALKVCETEPGPMANILSAGFSHVEEGFDVIQESIGAAADLETERIMQRLTWISVCANISPMVGLLGTVQGMILCFQNLGTGAPDVGSLALAISFSLWTTAAGLTVAIPAIAFYFGIRNNANRLILRMQAMTMELVKDLRNVEIVND
jgi:biopolymer transport protein ExbB